MPVLNSEFGAAELNGLIYAAGGFSPSNYHRFVIYDPEADSWSAGPDLPIGTHHAGVVALGGKIYVVGGEDAGDKLQIYDPRSGTWTEGASLLRPRNSMAAVVLNGRIHAIAGGPSINQGIAWQDHEVYDPRTDTWESRAGLPEAGEHISGAVIDGKIYVAGGRAGFSNRAFLQIYDPATDSWTAGAQMPNARSGHAVAALKGKLYAFGGEDIPGERVLVAGERYDPATDTWESVADIPEPLHGVAGTSLDGAIYVLGGANVAGSGAGSDKVYRFVIASRRPAKPTSLRASKIKKKRLRLSWNDNSDNEDAFVIQMRAPGERKFKTIGEVGEGVTKATIKGLDAGTTYRFRVRARDRGKKSRPSNRITVTTRG